MMHLDKTNEMIDRNLAHIRMTNHQTQQIQKTISSIENVIDWKMDDPRIISDDLRQQFLMKTKTKKTPSSGRASPRERIPLATTDFDVSFHCRNHTKGNRNIQKPPLTIINSPSKIGHIRRRQRLNHSAHLHI